MKQYLVTTTDQKSYVDFCLEKLLSFKGSPSEIPITLKEKNIYMIHFYYSITNDAD